LQTGLDDKKVTKVKEFFSHFCTNSQPAHVYLCTTYFFCIIFFDESLPLSCKMAVKTRQMQLTNWLPTFVRVFDS